MNNSHQAPANMATQGNSAGTFNQSPSIIVKPKLASKQNLELAVAPASGGTEKVKVDDQQPRTTQDPNEKHVESAKAEDATQK